MFNFGKNLGKCNCCVNYKFTIEKKKIMFQTELCFYQMVDVVLDFSVLRDITINCKSRAGLTHFSLLLHFI